jgi:hypothetical protein
VALDARWIRKLIEKPMVTLQTYNRSGVKYQDYDEMLLTLLPRKIADGDLKDALRNYFSIRTKSDDGETSLYADASERFAP